VTDEPEGKVTPYLSANNVQYLIGVGGGANAFQSRGIPASWLVDPDGNVIWQGHPSSLPVNLIEENLAKVRLTPKFDDIPDALSKAGKYLQKGQLGKGVEELEKIQKDPAQDPAAIESATQYLKKVTDFGKAELESAVRLGTENGYYLSGMTKLQQLKSMFKGCEIGDQADDKISEWKKDSSVKAHMEGEALVAQAEELIMKKSDPKKAKAILERVSEGKKYAGTKVAERAARRLANL